MSGKVLIKIQDENGSKIQEFQFDNSGQYRLLCFDREGRPKIFGRLPLKSIKKSSKSWVEDWASGQDITELKAALLEYCPGVSPETLLETSTDGVSIRQGMQQNYGEKDGAAIFALMWPMFTALIRRLKQALMRPVTTWQFAQSPEEGMGNILNWLFRRQNGNSS